MHILLYNTRKIYEENILKNIKINIMDVGIYLRCCKK